jgi:hypothetical protein
VLLGVVPRVTILVLIALKTISNLLEIIIIQTNDEQRFSRRKIVQSIIRMTLVSLYGMSDLSSIMSNYSDEVWFREMMQLMVMVMLMI